MVMSKRPRSRTHLVGAAVAAMVVPLAIPAAAGERSESRLDTYVVPVGRGLDAMKQLRLGGDAAEVNRVALAAEPRARLAAETVGPAARSSVLAKRASGNALPGLARRAAAAPAAVSYPEPSRTMSAAECKRGLGTDKSFFIKSRFAVCSGASFVQRWLRNNRPVGESMFNVFVVGTIASNSRTIKFTHHITDMETTGSTGASLMRVKLSASLPQHWPARATFTQAGGLPVTKSWPEMGRLGSFQHTVHNRPGQGMSGRVDTVFAIYQPSVKLTPPPAWQMGGATGGDLFMLAPRWDAASYLGNPTGGGVPARKGGAVFSYLATLRYSSKDGAPEQAVALHIKKAFTRPNATKPPNALKDVHGQKASEPLHRLYHDAERRKTNRARAVSTCRRYYGADYATGGKECDEYPFATTYQGCAEAEYNVYAEKKNFSAMPVPRDDNGSAGTLLGQFYKKNRVIDGPDDGFLVKITS
ncbi:NucA/NucB deoxyribonuclease domain-containing protein [Streptomyces sp. NPDC127068]|uniref:NucA/NucB deoxyribonuclease domain-containing protein n=1 Tax=Streptomyces sp. NPDC127068 TaxID=3347127 RepID=UPI00365451FF